jgi:hypothetical protein
MCPSRSHLFGSGEAPHPRPSGAAGQLICRLQRELTDERHAYDALNARYTQMIGAGDIPGAVVLIERACDSARLRSRSDSSPMDCCGSTRP